MLRCLILALALFSAPAVGAEAFAKFDGQTLSVNFRAVALEDGLRVIADETGISFKVDPGVTGTLNARFNDLPLDTAMSRLLRDYSHVVLYESTAEPPQVETVMILAEGAQQSVLPTPEPADADPTAMDEDDEPIDAQSNFLQPQPGGGTESGRTVTLKRHPSGHYVHAGLINGHPVTFMIDTGATAVALPESLAASLGIRRGSSRTVHTAAGRTLGYHARLDQVEIGVLSLDDVEAIVLPGLEIDQHVLLGMSFLARFELLQRRDILVIRELERP